MDKNYGGVIWTNHALQRLRERGVTQGDAWATWNRPEQSRKGSGSWNGAWVYYRTYGDTKIEVVAKQNENKKWIIISVWADKIFTGRQEKKKQLDKKSFWLDLLRKIFFND